MDDLKLYAQNNKDLESLVQTVQNFSDDLRRRMFYISSEQREITKFDGISLPDGRVMKGLIKGEGYKYLGILQPNQIMYKEMKK